MKPSLRKEGRERGSVGQQGGVWLLESALEGALTRGSQGWPRDDSTLEDSSNSSPAAGGWCGQKGEGATRMHRL